MLHLSDRMNIKSDSSRVQVSVAFENTTRRQVSIYWVDFGSVLVLYKVLEPSEKFYIDTYMTHPWVFCDKLTGERMMVNHKDVFWPKPVYIRKDPRQRLQMRILVRIHYPLRSLRDLALWRIMPLMEHEDDTDLLEIPKSLQFELYELCKKYRRYCYLIRDLTPGSSSESSS